MVAQILAVVLFVSMFVMLVLEKVERHIVTLVCGSLTVILVFLWCMRAPDVAWEVLSLESFVRPGFWYSTGPDTASSGVNWETICFIAGMMVMVEGMAASGFFRWLCMDIARTVDYRPGPIFIIFMILSAVLSMFIDSITVILFLAAVTAEIAKLLKISPVPMILAEIFCANLGGSATMCGDPPNIIIGTSLGYTFGDFIGNTGEMALLSMLVVVPYFYLVLGRKLKAAEDIDPSAFPEPASAIVSPRRFGLSTAIFLLAVVLLVSHAQTGLTVSTIGLFIAALTLLAAGKDAGTLLRRVDYKNLLFFIGLFLCVSGLEYTGVLKEIAGVIERLSGGSQRPMLAIIIWGSALASAFVDNIPFAATMIPVLRALSSGLGIGLDAPAWALSMGTDIGGSATPIGASANVVGTSIAAQNGYHISWGEYCKTQTPATLLVILICTVYILTVYV